MYIADRKIVLTPSKKWSNFLKNARIKKISISRDHFLEKPIKISAKSAHKHGRYTKMYIADRKMVITPLKKWS